MIIDLGDRQKCQGLICSLGGRSAGAHFHGKAAGRGWGSSLMLNVPRAVGLPWLQTQRQSYEPGLFSVQSCSFAKIKVQEQPQAPLGRCWRQKPGGAGAGPWEKGRASGTPPASSNRDFSSYGAGKICPKGDPTAIHPQPRGGEKLLQGLEGSRGKHPCKLCVCLLSTGSSVSIMHDKIRHNSCIYKQRFVIWAADEIFRSKVSAFFVWIGSSSFPLTCRFANVVPGPGKNIKNPEWSPSL